MTVQCLCRVRRYTLLRVVSSPLLALQVAQAFDAAKFNFTKALQKEVLCQFEPSLEQRPAYEAGACVKGSPNLVYINVSPIEYGHVLLVPRVMDCCPQVRASSSSTAIQPAPSSAISLLPLTAASSATVFTADCAGSAETLLAVLPAPPHCRFSCCPI